MERPIICITRTSGRPHAWLGSGSRRSLRESLELLQSIDQSCGDWPLGESARAAVAALREVLRVGAAPAPTAKSGRSRGSAVTRKDRALPVGDR